jgi:lipopolysaccharide/colanic/teichoic acid biosynthesis glycosyltransferase
MLQGAVRQEVGGGAGARVNGLSGRTSMRRVFDLTLGVASLIGLAPLMLIISLLIYLEDGGPVLFAQSRQGFGGRSFRCYKFRSMGVDSESRFHDYLTQHPEARAEWNRHHKLKNDPRITAVGGFLRKCSLDELPQLLNILKGEMTFIGPRPIVQAEVVRYGRYYRYYCAVRPGLTGLWQVSGRNDASYRSRVAMDVVYARSKTPILDLRILFATIPAVLFRRGSY